MHTKRLLWCIYQRDWWVCERPTVQRCSRALCLAMAVN